ncbi:MAG: NUDIX domain-containing protein [Ruminococcus sp.]|nr:NUDIX domain-containing protein [Ruminococcus sp.]MBR1751893.1 NUDIX domain-containing protein [Ruminococcus sp.]
MRDRSMALVIRGDKILVEELFYHGRHFFSLPGGGVEENETPEQTAVRELKEECGLDGRVIKKLTEVYRSDGSTEYVYEVAVPEDQTAIVGYDPEEPEDAQPIQDVCWKRLDELSEKDRAFMWSYGLMDAGGFFEELLTWGDSISYPTKEH